jgi:hypothetical protein
MHKLPCSHPDCPATFKSQHGQTYYICAVHTNFNSLSIDRENDQGYYGQDVDGLTDAGLASSWDHDTQASMPLDNSAHGERIQHSYLTSEYTINFEFLNMQ